MGVKPDGCCVTTTAYSRIVLVNSRVTEQLDNLDRGEQTGGPDLPDACARIRTAIESLVIPGQLIDQLRDHLVQLGSDAAPTNRSWKSSVSVASSRDTSPAPRTSNGR